MAVPFEIPILERDDGKHRSFLEWKTYLFVDPLKTKVDQLLLICCRLPYCLNVINFIQAMTLSSCKTVLCQSKTLQQFLRRNTPAFITADEWASYSPDLNALDYCIWDIQQDLVYKGRRLEVYRISKKQSKTNKRRSSLRQFENPLHDGKKQLMQLESRMEA